MTPAPYEMDRRFRELLAEWDANVIEGRRYGAAASEKTFRHLLAEMAGLVDDGRWRRGPTDVFGVLDIDRSELRHSAMIAWLADPLGHHGLGDRLLRGLTDRVGGWSADDLAAARPELEVTSSSYRADRRPPNSRADIIVWAPAATLVIENKVDAGEQCTQCKRLVQDLGHLPGAGFLYLTRTGVAPTTDPDRRFVSLGYPALADIIDNALTATARHPPGRARHHAADYVQVLRRI